MSDKIFLDTNVLIDSFDKDAPGKRVVACDIIQAALANGNGVISSQVVQEFLNVATRKFVEPLSADDCLTYLHSVLVLLCQIFPSISLYEKTLELRKQYNYSLYDSLVIAAALETQCMQLYSEDLQDGQKICELTIVNPFKSCNNQ